jgi:hypothetical protein
MSHHPVIPASPLGAPRDSAASAIYRSSLASPPDTLPADHLDAPAPADAQVTRRKRIVMALITPAFLLLATVGGHAAWTWQAERRFERYVQGLRASGEPVSCYEVLGPLVSEADNGAADLRAAADFIDGERWGDFYSLAGLGLPLTDQELQIIRPALAANTETLAKFHVARTKPSVEWAGIPAPRMRSSTSFWGGRGSGYFRYRALAHLLYTSALLARSEGDHRTAFERLDDLLFLADAMSRRTGKRGQENAQRLYEISGAAVAELLPGLSIGGGSKQVPPAAVKSMIARLLDEQAAREGMLRGLRAERARYIESMLPSARTPGPAGAALATALSAEGQWIDPLPLPPPPSGFEDVLSRPVYLLRAQEMLDRLNLAIASFAAPDLSEFLLAFPAEELSGMRGARQSEPQAEGDVSRMLTSSIQHLGRGYYAGLARRRIAAAALAVALYHAEHGRWPERGLAELVPAYLPALPGDPLSTCGHPVIFIADPDRPRVYSVGDDGIDDGGWPGEPYTGSRREDVRLTDWVVDLLRQPRINSQNVWRRG